VARIFSPASTTMQVCHRIFTVIRGGAIRGEIIGRVATVKDRRSNSRQYLASKAFGDFAIFLGFLRLIRA
jgi:hypothetical protein